MELAPREVLPPHHVVPITVPPVAILASVATLGYVTFRWDLVPLPTELSATPARWAPALHAPSIAVEPLQARLLPAALPSRDAIVVVDAAVLLDAPGCAPLQIGTSSTSKRSYGFAPSFENSRMVYEPVPNSGNPILSDPTLLCDGVLLLTVRALTRQKKDVVIGRAALALRHTRAHSGKVWLRVLPAADDEHFAADNHESTLARFAVDTATQDIATGLIEVAWAHNFARMAPSSSSSSSGSREAAATGDEGDPLTLQLDNSNSTRLDSARSAAPSFNQSGDGGTTVHRGQHHHHDRSGLDDTYAELGTATGSRRSAAREDAVRLLVTVVQLRDFRLDRCSKEVAEAPPGPRRVRIVLGCGRRSMRTVVQTVTPHRILAGSSVPPKSLPVNQRFDEGFEFPLTSLSADAQSNDLRVQIEVDGVLAAVAKLPLTGALDIGFDAAAFRWLRLSAVGDAAAEGGGDGTAGELLIAAKLAEPHDGGGAGADKSRFLSEGGAARDSADEEHHQLATPRAQRFGVAPGGAAAVSPERRGGALSPASTGKHVSFSRVYDMAASTLGRIGVAASSDRRALLAAIAGWRLQIVRCSALPFAASSTAPGGDAPCASVELAWPFALSAPAYTTHVVPDTTDPFFGEECTCLLPAGTTVDTLERTKLTAVVSHVGADGKRVLLGTATLPMNELLLPTQGSIVLTLDPPTTGHTTHADIADSRQRLSSAADMAEYRSGPGGMPTSHATVEIGWVSIDADEDRPTGGDASFDLADTSAIGRPKATRAKGPAHTVEVSMGVLKLLHVPPRLRDARLIARLTIGDGGPRASTAAGTTQFTSRPTSHEAGFIIGQYFSQQSVQLPSVSAAAVVRLEVFVAADDGTYAPEPALVGDFALRATDATEDRTFGVPLRAPGTHRAAVPPRQHLHLRRGRVQAAAVRRVPVAAGPTESRRCRRHVEFRPTCCGGRGT
jgi:hypothetical protein